jgi:hypothetical protein
MKLAHLILAHKNPLQVERLVKRLIHPCADIYIQLDGKTSMEAFAHLNAFNVFFINKRINIHWGNYSIVQATLYAFEEILESDHSYSHINLLSGEDYPLQNNDRLLNFLFNNQHKTFMHSLSIDDEWQEAQPRIRKYHFGDFMFRGRYLLQAVINLFAPSRELPDGYKAYGRSQWFAITPDCAVYVIEILKNNERLRRYFRMTWAPDEFIFQTILHNSPFKDSVVNDNLRYIVFKPGNYHPETMTIADADTLINSGKFFARKFNMESERAIMDHLDFISEAEPERLKAISS